jgi:hypothetical protein
MALRELATTTVAALIGAVVGSLMTSWARPPERGSRDSVSTHEVLILNSAGRPAARLGSGGDGATLRFFVNSEPALEIGIDPKGENKFIHFFGKQHQVVAALNSLPPDGGSTLYLGDERWEGRIRLGALVTDMDYGRESIQDWGMQFRQPYSNRIPLSLLMQPFQKGYRAGVRIERESGEPWVAP